MHKVDVKLCDCLYSYFLAIYKEIVKPLHDHAKLIIKCIYLYGRIMFIYEYDAIFQGKLKRMI